MPKLTLTITHGEKKRVVELDQDHVTIGRPDLGNTPDISMIPDRRVSRQHAELYYEDGVWWARDLKSTRGTERDRENSTVAKVTPYSATELLPGDTLLLAESSTIQVEYESEAVDPNTMRPAYEQIDENNTTKIDEAQRPQLISERMLMRVMSGLSSITQTQSGNALLELCLEKIQEVFVDRADQLGILLRKNKELSPYASIPRGRTQIKFSYTLARHAIQREEAFRWNAEQSQYTDMPANPTTYGVLEAIYAPMIFDTEVVGVVYVGTEDPDVNYTDQELDVVSLIATQIAQPLRSDWSLGEYKADRYPQVFISYSRKDKPFIMQLADDLRKRMVRVWFDEHLDMGESWRENLAIAIQQAHGFVLVMSPDSVVSDYVKWEIDIARGNHKKIFPVMYRKTNAPATIQHLHYLKSGEPETEPEMYEKMLAELVHEIKTHGREIGLEV